MKFTLHGNRQSDIVSKMTTVVFCLILLFSVATNADFNPKFFYVVGGEKVPITQYPYQASLQRAGKPHCGGSIISEDFILTAAHCLKDFDISTIQVRIGSSDVGNGGQLYDVSEGFMHDGFNSTIYDYDVALLKVSKKMEIDDKTTKIVKLADAWSSLAPGDRIRISGWGKVMEEGPYSKELRAVALPVLPPKTCEAAFTGTSSQFTKRMFCAGYPEGGKDSCIGDSGGPAVVGAKDTLVQYGIVSWGRGCARGRFPGVYTAVPAVRDWIKQYTGI